MLLPLLLALLLPSASGAAPGGETPGDDVVPRDRLVTDAELVGLVERGGEAWTTMAASLAAGDTVRALHALGTWLSNREAPRYFFDAVDVPARVDLLRRTYPEAARRAVENADLFIEAYGAEPDWRMPGQNLLGEPHTPNIIRFLARQWRAEDIALAYHLEGDARYLAFLRQHVRHFVGEVEAGRAQAGANDVFERFYAGHRTRNWVLMHHLLRAAPEYGPEDEVYMLKVFLLHGARLYDQSRRFNWGNHQLHGLAGLYEMSTLYPELPVMRTWNRQAIALLAEHLEREVATDGLQFERASHYHLLDILNYFRTYQIAARNGAALPDFYAGRFRSMFDAVVALALPTRDLPILQDVSADFDTRTDPVAREMSLGALLFRDPVYRYFAADRLPAEYFWFFDVDALSAYAELAARPPTLGSTALPESHYYVMRTGWGEDDLYLLIDGGLAEHKPDHTHGGVLGVIGYGRGEQFLPNYPVMYRHPSYKTLKNSYAKSVALVDGVPQGRDWIDNKSRTGFGIFGALPQPTVTDWVAGDAFDLFRGEHDGFNHLGVAYGREVYFFKPSFWVVRDRFEGERAHSFQQIWQGAYEVPPYDPQPFRHSGASYFTPDEPPVNRAVQAAGGGRLHVVQADPDRMNVTARRDFFVDSVEFEKEARTAYTFTTLLYPSPASDEASPRVEQFQRPGEFEEVVVRDGRHTGYLYFFPEAGGEVELVRSDGGVVALRYDGGDLEAALVHEGTHVRTGAFALTLDRRATVELQQRGGSWTAALRGAGADATASAACGATLFDLGASPTPLPAPCVTPPDPRPLGTR